MQLSALVRITGDGVKVGFTGTQGGMRGVQKFVVENNLLRFWTPDSWFHHGVCIGADEEAATTAKDLGYKLHGHPPINTSKMSTILSDVSSPPGEYLDRNRDIVDECDLLVAAPATMRAVVRSGTWFTWRYAVKLRRPRILVYPDGSFREFGLDTLLLQRVQYSHHQGRPDTGGTQ